MIQRRAVRHFYPLSYEYYCSAHLANAFKDRCKESKSTAKSWVALHTWKIHSYSWMQTDIPLLYSRVLLQSWLKFWAVCCIVHMAYSWSNMCRTWGVKCSGCVYVHVSIECINYLTNYNYCWNHAHANCALHFFSSVIRCEWHVWWSTINYK